MKILSRKNGIALVAVLAVLLVLTLLLPVMFRSSQTATYSAAMETNKQKASYLARTGVEMTVAALKSTIYNETHEDFYKALKNEEKKADEAYGITKNATTGFLEFSVEPIWLFKDNAGESYYVSGKAESDAVKAYTEDSKYKHVGTTETTVSFNGDPEYFDLRSGTYVKTTYENATAPVMINGKEAEDSKGNKIREIKEGFIAIYNDNYIVKSTATVEGQKFSRTAAVMETRDMLDENDNNEGFVAYTEQYWSLAPEFVRIIEGDSPTPNGGYTVNGQPEKDYSFGGNQVFANPFMASSKKQIKAFGKNVSGVTLDENSYYNKDVYIFSTIGNMHINLPDNREYVTVIDHTSKDEKGGNVTNYLALGAYPGLNWRVYENTTSDYKPALQGQNYNGYSSGMQRYNFVSFCATDTLQVSLPIELRVNPKRSNRGGDHKIGKYEPNATLFKVINFQAKDIVFDKRIDLFVSICDQEFGGAADLQVVSDGDKQTAYRGGFVNLTAPANTPYSYVNSGRENKIVSAGIVYFQQPVYLWFQDWNALGTDALLKTKTNGGGDTLFRTGQVSKSTQWKTISSNPLIQEAVSGVEDFRVFKLFEEGDVYYFNADITTTIDGKESNVGVNLVNWFLETKYYPVSKAEKDILDYIFDLKKTLYTTQVADLIAKNGNYVLDDMHYIGNMKKNPTLIAPETDEELYVVWDY